MAHLLTKHSRQATIVESFLKCQGQKWTTNALYSCTDGEKGWNQNPDEKKHGFWQEKLRRKTQKG